MSRLRHFVDAMRGSYVFGEGGGGPKCKEKSYRQRMLGTALFVYVRRKVGKTSVGGQ